MATLREKINDYLSNLHESNKLRVLSMLFNVLVLACLLYAGTVMLRVDKIVGSIILITSIKSQSMQGSLWKIHFLLVEFSEKRWSFWGSIYERCRYAV